jgi:hypothetical protein
MQFSLDDFYKLAAHPVGAVIGAWNKKMSKTGEEKQGGEVTPSSNPTPQPPSSQLAMPPQSQGNSAEEALYNYKMAIRNRILKEKGMQQ